jgi:very-short-patch-repair endonuclease
VYGAARPGSGLGMTRAPLRDLSDVVFLRREAIADGYTDRAIRALVKADVWHRVRHGAYVSGALWAELDAADRHRVRARAVLRTAHPATVLSHVSATIEHGAPVWGVDLEVVHVTRTDGKPRRREAGVVHHTGVLPDDDLVQVNDVRATIPLRAAAEMTTVVSVESALVSVDALLRLAGADRDEVVARHAAVNRWPRSLASQVVFRLADPRHESPGESRTAYFCWRMRLPRPEPQVKVRDEDGIVVARLDFAWVELGVYLEFDGKEKYRRFRREDETLDEFLMREKKREELIGRLTGWTCIRIGWAELHQPELLARRIRAILDSRRTNAS